MNVNNNDKRSFQKLLKWGKNIKLFPVSYRTSMEAQYMKIIEKDNFAKFSDLNPGEVFVPANGSFNCYFIKVEDGNGIEYAINLNNGLIYIREDHSYEAGNLEIIDFDDGTGECIKEDEAVYTVECELHIKKVKGSNSEF